jgi:threonine dehydrogenase-like Zn-dependent dehydrogenase
MDSTDRLSIGVHEFKLQYPSSYYPAHIVYHLLTLFPAICGSDLHMYQGRTAAESGLVFGHENMGVVTEIGSGVTLLKKGDRIVLPFNVADGRCRNCEAGKTAFCTGES